MVVQGLNDNNKVPIIRQSGDSQPLVSCHGKGQPVIKRGTTEVAGEERSQIKKPPRCVNRCVLASHKTDQEHVGIANSPHYSDYQFMSSLNTGFGVKVN